MRSGSAVPSRSSASRYSPLASAPYLGGRAPPGTLHARPRCSVERYTGTDRSHRCASTSLSRRATRSSGTVQAVCLGRRNSVRVSTCKSRTSPVSRKLDMSPKAPPPRNVR